MWSLLSHADILCLCARARAGALAVMPLVVVAFAGARLVEVEVEVEVALRFLAPDAAPDAALEDLAAGLDPPPAAVVRLDRVLDFLVALVATCFVVVALRDDRLDSAEPEPFGAALDADFGVADLADLEVEAARLLAVWSCFVLVVVAVSFTGTPHTQRSPPVASNNSTRNCSRVFRYPSGEARSKTETSRSVNSDEEIATDTRLLLERWPLTTASPDLRTPNWPAR